MQAGLLFRPSLTEAKAVLEDGDASQDSVNRVLASAYRRLSGAKGRGPYGAGILG